MYLSDGNDRVVEMAKITHELSKKEEIIAQLSEEIQKYRESDATNGKSGWKGTLVLIPSGLGDRFLAPGQAKPRQQGVQSPPRRLEPSKRKTKI